jgi:hypothetical protein
MTSQRTAHGRFTRALATRNLFQAELALREMGTPSLLVALDYLDLLAEVKPEKLEPVRTKTAAPFRGPPQFCCGGVLCLGGKRI